MIGFILAIGGLVLWSLAATIVAVRTDGYGRVPDRMLESAL